MFIYFLIRHRISELARPIATKFCHMISICADFIMQVQKLGGPPLKNFGAKNMQNLGQFYSTSDFDHEYLRNDRRYPNRKATCSRPIPPAFGETNRWTCSTIQKVWHVSLDPLKLTFSGNYISAPSGCWPFRFLHTLDTGQGLPAHTTNRVVGPPKIVRANIKNWA